MSFQYEVSLPGPVEVRSLKPFPFMYTLYPTDVRRLAKVSVVPGVLVSCAVVLVVTQSE